jgi:hypothetical protein
MRSAQEVDRSWIAADPAPPEWRRLVLVLVGGFDRRTTDALAYSWRIPAHERRALHVATDEREVWALADAWMGSRAPYRLHMVEDDGGVAATVRRVVELERDGGFDEVVVIVGRLGLRRRWHSLLHDRTADAIRRTLEGVDGVVPTVMTVAAT